MTKTTAIRTGRQRLRFRVVALVVALGGLAGPLIAAVSPVYAAGTQLYLSPATINANKGATFEVAVRVNAGDIAINAIQANFTYPANQVEFVSISAKNSSFETSAPSSGGSGRVEIARGQIGGVKGDALFATVTFKALAGSGSAKMDFTDGTQTLRDDNNTNNLAGTTGTTITLKGDSAPTSSAGGTSNSAAGSTSGVTPDAAGPSGSTETTSDKPAASTDKPTVTTDKYATIKPLDDKSVQGQSTGAKAAIFSISVLLVVAAAIFGTMYFRRRHQVHLAPSGYGGSQVMAAASNFGPPTPSTPGGFASPTGADVSSFGSDSAKSAMPATVLPQVSDKGPVGELTSAPGTEPASGSPATAAPSASSYHDLETLLSPAAPTPTAAPSSADTSLPTVADEPAQSTSGLAAPVTPPTTAATEAVAPGSASQLKPAEPQPLTSLDELAASLGGGAASEVHAEPSIVAPSAPAEPAVADGPVPATEALAPATAPTTVTAPGEPALPAKPNIQPRSHGVILAPPDPTEPRPVFSQEAPRPKVAMPEAVRPHAASTVIRPGAAGGRASITPPPSAATAVRPGVVPPPTSRPGV